MTTRTMFKFSTETVHETLREYSVIDIQTWCCACGCGTAAHFGWGKSPEREDDVLFLISEISPTPSLHLVGLETHADVDEFVDRMATNFKKRDERDDLLTFRLALHSAFTSRAAS